MVCGKMRWASDAAVPDGYRALGIVLSNLRNIKSTRIVSRIFFYKISSEKLLEALPSVYTVSLTGCAIVHGHITFATIFSPRVYADDGRRRRYAARGHGYCNVASNGRAHDAFDGHGYAREQPEHAFGHDGNGTSRFEVLRQGKRAIWERSFWTRRMGPARWWQGQPADHIVQHVRHRGWKTHDFSEACWTFLSMCSTDSSISKPACFGWFSNSWSVPSRLSNNLNNRPEVRTY